MSETTLFSFGYWGWGSATAQLVESIDAVEAARGFEPPLFVDIRISRSVRAKGFSGAAFAHLVGEARYRWLDALGNLGVMDGGTMRIKDPEAANQLLDLAVDCARKRRRLLLFCACERPCACHRSVVTVLALAAGRRRRLPIEVIEWPGGEPQLDLSLVLTRPEFDKVRRGASSVPLRDQLELRDSAAVPWYSLLRVRPDDADGSDGWPTWRLRTGPAKCKSSGWYLPVYGVFDGEPDEAVRAEVKRLREQDGYVSQRSEISG
jgi:hypothetical protein